MNAVAIRPGSAERLVPSTLRPMLARLAEGPLDDPSFAYEIKWDGMRVLAGTAGERMSLVTRNGIEAAPRFPELEELHSYLSTDRTILDGEIVVLKDGRPDFWLLQQRIQASRPERIRRLRDTMPAALILFDVLRIGDEWLLDKPWSERRARLDSLVAPGDSVQLSPVWADGEALWDTVVRLDLEGVMAKLRTSRYVPGARSPMWRKIKVSATVDVVVGGWTEGAGERGGGLGALIVGCPGEGGLRYLGHVGTGFDNAALADALARLRPLATVRCPFSSAPATNAPAHWVRPELMCEVRHQGWSGERRLRAPVFVRWRPDKLPEECGT